MSDLSNRNVVIAGASGGLGLAVASALARAGARLYLPLFEAAVPDSIAALGSSVARAVTAVDLGREGDVVGFFAQVPELWASIHLTGGFAMGPIEDTSLADFDRMMRINAVSCFLCCREASRRMGANGGRMVNVAARPVLAPAAELSAYAASKAAVAALTQTLAVELASRGVLVNAIVPSIIDTPHNRAAMPAADPSWWPSPEEIASTIAFLASPANTLTSGALVPVYGRA